MHFRDMTFCGSDCTRSTCRRHFGPDDRAAARKWWGSDNAPVAMCDYSPNCDDYERPTGSSS